MRSLGAISIRPEVTFARLRYSLGGDRPSQTARLARSPAGSRSGLEFQYTKGGIPTATPYYPKVISHSLPPILCVIYRNPVPSYSEAPRGLSVPPQVPGVFTRTTISPDLLSRQRSDRYTIRAGRNLPDKEFRYLRTVIVTAAVYWGFISKLRPRGLTSPFNLPAPGRCQTLYFGLRLMQSPVFLVNSRLSLVSATCLSLVITTSPDRHPFSLSYGVILQSSLTIVIPLTLASSASPPVSVSGTGAALPP